MSTDDADDADDADADLVALLAAPRPTARPGAQATPPPTGPAPSGGVRPGRRRRRPPDSGHATPDHRPTIEPAACAVMPAPAPGPMPAGVEPAAGVGDWFQPMPGGLLPVPVDRHGRTWALLVGPVNSRVHSPTSATVASLGGDGTLVLRTEDDSLLSLLPEQEVAWCVLPGAPVGPGSVVGVVAGAGNDRRLRLLVAATDRKGMEQDAVDLLSGLPDPGELRAGGDGAEGGPGGRDPYAHDLELARRSKVPEA